MQPYTLGGVRLFKMKNDYSPDWRRVIVPSVDGFFGASYYVGKVIASSGRVFVVTTFNKDTYLQAFLTFHNLSYNDTSDNTKITVSFKLCLLVNETRLLLDIMPMVTSLYWSYFQYQILYVARFEMLLLYPMWLLLLAVAL
jgi:hypothetical protein